MTAALAFPDMQASQPFDLESAIADTLTSEMGRARKMQEFGRKLHEAIESSRLFDRLAAEHDYYPAMMDLARSARHRVDVLFDSRPSQIAEQTMRIV